VDEFEIIAHHIFLRLGECAAHIVVGNFVTGDLQISARVTHVKRRARLARLTTTSRRGYPFITFAAMFSAPCTVWRKTALRKRSNLRDRAVLDAFRGVVPDAQHLEPALIVGNATDKARDLAAADIKGSEERASGFVFVLHVFDIVSDIAAGLGARLVVLRRAGRRLNDHTALFAQINRKNIFF
jgi:hypothetical protein